MVYVFLADGFEEIEARTPVDILRRGGVEVVTVGVNGKNVVSSHRIPVTADIADSDIQSFDGIEAVVLPGGMPGTLNLEACSTVKDAVAYCAEHHQLIGAICAAPSIFAEEGLLKGVRATSNPGFQHVLAEQGADLVADEPVVVDGNFTTSQGMGTAIDFGLEIVRRYKGDDEVERLKGAVVYWRR